MMLGFLLFTFCKLAVQIPLALVVEVFLNGKGKFKSFIRTGFFLPSIISVAVMVLIFFISNLSIPQ